MMKFQSDRLELLKELSNVVSKQLDNAKVNVDLESEVADLLTETTDRRQARRLKLIQRELTKWIDEVLDYKREERKANVS